MRAILLGLVGVVLAGEAAQADYCKLDGATLIAQSQTVWSMEIQRPDLIGRKFRVERVASRWDAPKVAVITVLIRSDADAFLVRQISDFSGAPVDAVYSIAATDTALRSIKWDHRDASVERTHFSGEFNGITSGPLVSLGLAAQNCT